MKTSKSSSIFMCAIAIAAAVSLAACAPQNGLSQNAANAVGVLPDDHTLEGTDAPDLKAATEYSKLIQSQFSEPAFTEQESSSILSNYSFVDPNGVVPKAMLNKALAYYAANSSKISNKNYIWIVDFSKHSSKARMYIVNMSTGSVWTIHVAHGSGSDPDNDGYLKKFSNSFGSNASSNGFFLTAETYSGNHGYSLRIDGLSSTNSNVRARAVVIHGASYVQEASVQAGRSWGCFAVTDGLKTKVVNMLKGGALGYAGKGS